MPQVKLFNTDIEFPYWSTNPVVILLLEMIEAHAAFQLETGVANNLLMTQELKIVTFYTLSRGIKLFTGL